MIGMPGAGKSTIGVLLAKELNYHFLDSDLVIQEKAGRLLREIIAEDGLEAFIRLEERVNAELEAEHTVIATGGSVVYGKKAMEHFKKMGKCVYLKLSYEAVSERVGSPKKRGVVLKKSQTFLDLYEERCPLYERYADIVIEADGLEIGEILEKIKESFTNEKKSGIMFH
jgi:shikimate kinase